MENYLHLKNQLAVARKELKNLRTQIISVKKKHDHDIKSVLDMLDRKNNAAESLEISSVGVFNKEETTDVHQEIFQFKPIGRIHSMFKQKNGTPRQAGVCPNAHASLEISNNIFSNPAHSLQGLESFSHIWILFLFHKNNGQYTGAKIKPPRLNGAKVGLFATRCPYRPNPVGLTLAKIHRIEGGLIHLFGIDLLDGTPVLDIKPYIPQYDTPTTSVASSKQDIDWSHEELDCTASELSTDGHSDQEDLSISCGEVLLNDDEKTGDIDDSIVKDRIDVGENVITSNFPPDACQQDVKKLSVDRKTDICSVSYTADWVKSPPTVSLSVRFTAQAEDQLTMFSQSSTNAAFRLVYLTDACQLRSAIINILSADPRSTYRRKHCSDRLYYATVDRAHITCWFDDKLVEVLKVQATEAASTVS